MNQRSYHIHRKEPLSMEDVVDEYIKSMKLAAGLNTQLVFKAWDACSGAGPFTLRRYFRGGRLYITLGSSVVRSQLWYQRDLLIEKMNRYLSEDPLFTDDNRATGFVKELILK